MSIDVAIDLYLNSNTKIDDISRVTKIHHKYIYAELKKRGLPRRTKTVMYNPTQSDIRKISQMYYDRVPVTTIASEMGTNTYWIDKLVRQYDMVREEYELPVISAGLLREDPSIIEEPTIVTKNGAATHVIMPYKDWLEHAKTN